MECNNMECNNMKCNNNKNVTKIVPGTWNFQKQLLKNYKNKKCKIATKKLQVVKK